MQDPNAPVAAWPPIDEGDGGVPVPSALVVSGAKAQEAQPVPAKVRAMRAL